MPGQIGYNPSTFPLTAFCSGAGVDEQFKRRLVGAAVLASLAVIFIPMLFEDESKLQPPPLYQTQIPDPPTPPFEP